MKIVTEKKFYACVNEDGKAEIIRYDGNKNKIKIPDELDGYQVNALGDSLFFRNTDLKKVSIPPHVTKIGERVFAHCKSLKEIELPDSLEEIGSEAFLNVPISEVKFSDSLKKISYGAFCRTKLTEIFLPDSLVEIKGNAFSQTMLSEVIIPDSVEKINATAFDECLELTYIQIGSGAKRVCVCGKCRKLERISVSAYNQNFCDIDGVLFDKAAEKLIKYPAGKCGECYEIPSTVKEIGSNAFENAKVKRIICPKGLKTIGADAFLNSSLVNINIPDTVSYVVIKGRFRDDEWDCFSPKVKFEISEEHEWYEVKNGRLERKPKETTYHESAKPDIKTSGIFKFKEYNHCAYITEITDCPEELIIPETLDGLPVAHFSESLPSIFFSYCPKKIVLPKTISKAFSGDMFVYFNDLIEEIQVSPDNPYYYSKDGILFRYAVEPQVSAIRPLPGEYGVKLCCCPMRFSDKDSYRIPDGVEYIGEFAFYHIHNIKRIIVPESVKLIFSNAFRYCVDLEEIIIENGCVALICEYAFFSNDKLKKIIIPKSVTKISDHAISLPKGNPPVICCEKDSAAHLYAIKQKLPFKLR